MTAAEQNSIDRRAHERAPLDGPLGRFWRQVWTALSFVLFGLGALLFGGVVFPGLWLLVRNRDRRERLARNLIAWLFGAFIRFMGLFVLSWETRNLPTPATKGTAGGAVIAANHPTLIDAVFLLWLFPGADCVVKAAHWRNPLMMFAVRAAGYLPNADDEILLKEAVARVRSGRCLLLFPQGTRTRPGEEPRFRRGAAVIAARAQAPLLPVRIRCEPPALRKGEPWLRVPERRGHFLLEGGEPLDPAHWTRDGAGEREGTRALTERLSALLLEGLH